MDTQDATHSTAETDPERVSFGQISDAWLPRVPGSAIATQFPVWTGITIFVLGAGSVAVLDRMISPALGVPIGLRIAITVGVGLALLLYATRRQLARFWAWYNAPYIPERLRVDPAARVRCFGWNHVMGPPPQPEDEPFEPVIVPVLMPEGINRTFGLTWAAGAIVTALAIAAIMRVLGLGAFIFGGAYIIMAVSAMLGLSLAAWLRPSYLRILPGRIDVFRYGLLGARPPRVRKIAIRGARVDIALSGMRALAVHPPPGDGNSAYLLFHSAWSAERVAGAIMRAAVCSHPTPDAPDDALVG